MGVPLLGDSRDEPEPAGEPAAGVVPALLGDFFPSEARLKTARQHPFYFFF